MVGKEPVPSLVERGGKVRSHHIANVNAKALRPLLTEQINKASRLMTDESAVYLAVGRDFARHGSVSHSIGWYGCGDDHTNTFEGCFSIFKRGIFGTYHHVNPAHLKHSLAEFDFRNDERSSLGVADDARMAAALRGIVGKRLTYPDPPAA